MDGFLAGAVQGDGYSQPVTKKGASTVLVWQQRF